MKNVDLVQRAGPVVRGGACLQGFRVFGNGFRDLVSLQYALICTIEKNKRGLKLST